MTVERFSDDRLREEFLDRPAGAGGGEACPPRDVLWQSARGELDRKKNEQVLLHLGECAACAAAWRFASEVVPDRTSAAALGTVRGIARHPWTRAAAAVLVVAVGLGWFLLRPDGRTTPDYRTQEEAVVVPTTVDDAVLSRNRFLLEWVPGPEGTTYHVRVTDENLEPLAEGLHLERSEFLVPEEALAGTPGGAAVYWQVTARLPDGRRVDSASFRVVVRPDPS